MKYMVAGHEAASADEFVALAFGIERELFTGTPGESEMDREARLDVASEVLGELYESDPEAWRFALELLRSAPVPPRRRQVPRTRTNGTITRRIDRKGVAA